MEFSRGNSNTEIAGRQAEVRHRNNAWRRNNNSRIISRSHYTIINHAFSHFRGAGPGPDVLDVEGQQVAGPGETRFGNHKCTSTGPCTIRSAPAFDGSLRYQTRIRVIVAVNRTSPWRVALYRARRGNNEKLSTWNCVEVGRPDRRKLREVIKLDGVECIDGNERGTGCVIRRLNVLTRCRIGWKKTEEEFRQGLRIDSSWGTTERDSWLLDRVCWVFLRIEESYLICLMSQRILYVFLFFIFFQFIKRNVIIFIR